MSADGFTAVPVIFGVATLPEDMPMVRPDALAFATCDGFARNRIVPGPCQQFVIGRATTPTGFAAGTAPEFVVTDMVIDGNTLSHSTSRIEFGVIVTTSGQAGTVIESDAVGLVFGRPSALPDEVGVNAFPNGATSSVRVVSTPDRSERP